MLVPALLFLSACDGPSTDGGTPAPQSSATNAPASLGSATRGLPQPTDFTVLATETAEDRGVDVMVKADVLQSCTHQGEQPPASAFKMVLDRADQPLTSPPETDVSSEYPNMWSTGYDHGPPENRQEIRTESTTTLVWGASPSNASTVPYGEVQPFGYSLIAGPTHRMTSEWLFGTVGPDAHGCVVASVSTAWYEAAAYPNATRQQTSPPRGVLVDVAQHSRPEGLTANLAYVATNENLVLADLNRTWLQGNAPVALASDATLAIGVPLTVQLPVSDGDTWIVLIGEWREGDDRTQGAQPLLTTFHAVRTSAQLPPRPESPASN